MTSEATYKAQVVHETPLMYSDDKPHELNDKGECWCRPHTEMKGVLLWVTHR
jgi:hypothetical protein